MNSIYGLYLSKDQVARWYINCVEAPTIYRVHAVHTYNEITLFSGLPYLLWYTVILSNVKIINTNQG